MVVSEYGPSGIQDRRAMPKHAAWARINHPNVTDILFVQD